VAPGPTFVGFPRYWYVSLYRISHSPEEAVMKRKAQVIAAILLSFVGMGFVAARPRQTQKSTTPSQSPESADREIGKSYATLRPEQQRLVDDFVRRYNQATGSELAPEEAYDKARLSVRTTFDAVSHALLNAKMTDATGKDLGHAIDLVEAIDEIMGQEAGVAGDRQFRLYAYLKPNAFDILSNSQEFFRDKDNVTYHKGFPICFRLKNGPPSIQFSISRDKKLSDIDVDYRSTKFPQALVNGHLTAANSDVRAGNNLGTHDRRWAGLSGWWRDLFAQLGTGKKPPKESASERLAAIPLNPGVKAAEGVDKSAHDFLQTWVVDKQPNKSVAYFSRRSYPCLEAMSEKQQKNISPGMVQLRLDMALREFATSVGNVSSVTDVFAADNEWSSELKEAKNGFAPEFRLVALPADMASDEECVSIAEHGSAKQLKGKSYATTFREKRGAKRVMLLVWTQESGYWKIIAIRLEDSSSDATIIPKNSTVQVEPAEEEPQKITPDPTVVKDITNFYQAWILKRDVKQALPFISQRSYQCLTPPSEDQKKLAPLARIQSGLEQPLNEIASGENLGDMMSSVQPVNELVRPVEQENSNALAIMAVPDQMADSFLCENRPLPEERPELQPGEAKYGTYYMSASQLKFGEEQSPTFLLLWAKEEAHWKLVAWAVDAP
jgi:hypothetical protein